MSYKDKQKEYRDKTKEKKVFYESGKRVGTYGQIIKKGTPFRKDMLPKEQESHKEA